jgi:CxxC motif-containing protein
MKKNFTCIICPNSCDIEVMFEGNTIGTVNGASCPKGIEYVKNEMIHPMRTITTSVFVQQGILPLVSVKLDTPIPKEKIFEVMKFIREIKVTAPVVSGQIIITNILGLKSNVVATKTVEKV